MTPAEKEAEKVHDVYKEALAALGAKAFIEMMSAYADVVIDGGPSFSRFTTIFAGIIYQYRRLARDLSVAMSRYERALLTGQTYTDWMSPSGGQSTMRSLRDEFAYQAEKAGSDSSRLRGASLRTIKQVSIPQLQADEMKSEQLLDIELDTTLRVLGEDVIKNGLTEIKDDMPMAKVIDMQERIKQRVASRLLPGGERIVMNAARDNDARIVKFDRKALGYTRVHNYLADQPCGWCSMLMTRGFMKRSGLYKWETAGAAEGEDGFHPGCHCTIVKVYSLQQLESPKFDANREYASLWPRVTKGLYGEDARSEWRKYIRNRPVAREAAA